MSNQSVTPFTMTGRLLVAGAVFLFVLLVAAAAITSGMGLEVRERLSGVALSEDSRAGTAAELDRLLGRGGFAGQLLGYATSRNDEDVVAMERLLDQAANRANTFLRYGSEPFARQYWDVVRGRIAQGRLALASITSGSRDASLVAVEYAGDLAAFDEAYTQFRTEEQRIQTLEALEVLGLQRWITSLALAAAVFVMGAAALLLHMNVRRPLRQLAENLEDLLTDDEDRVLSAVDRSDEIGMVARVAEELRKTQLQAGRLLTVGADGALRLRLEGSNALAVDDALQEISTAADTLRTSALSLSASGEEMAGESKDAMARVESALDETVEETSGRLGALSDAGEEVLRLAADLEGTRRTLASTENDWRIEMASLAETMRGELERLRVTTERLMDSTETAGARVKNVTGELDEIAASWKIEQGALNEASSQARENLTARLVTLDDQIENLDDALSNLQDLTARAVPPIESAAGKLGQTVQSLTLASESASTATAMMSKEAEAARNARLSVISEAEADRAHWQKERGAIRQQAEDMIAQMTETTDRVESVARELSQSAEGVPGKLDRVTSDLASLSTKIEALEQTGGALASQLGGRLAAVHEALNEAQSALVDEANVIRGVTSNLSDMHMTFESESRAVADQVGTLAATLQSLDGQLQTINERVATPIDLSPVLAALRNEVGQAVTHLTRTVEDQALSAQGSLSDAFTQLGDKIDDQSGAQEQLIATGLSELSVRLDSKIAAQSDAAQRLASILNDLNKQIGDLSSVQAETIDAVRAGMGHPISAGDIAALIEPKIEMLDDAAHAVTSELQSLAREFSDRENRAAPELVAQINRIESLQGGLGQAQQAIAMALHDGIKGIAHRLKTSDVRTIGKQLDQVMATLVRQQDRLAEIMVDMSTDMGERIDDLAGEIARGNRQSRTPRKGLFSRAGKEPEQAEEPDPERLSQTPPPQENELSAIYAALRGLTEELKGLSDDTTVAKPSEVADIMETDHRSAV